MSRFINLLVLVTFINLSWGQKLVLLDSIKIDVPDSFTFYQADIFNSLYFVSHEDNTLLKYDHTSKNTYILKSFSSSKKLFIVNPLFLVSLDKINKVLEFYDDKLISTQDNVPILTNQLINPDLIYVQDNHSLLYFDELNSLNFIQYDYRSKKTILFSNTLSKDLLDNYVIKTVYSSKQSKFLLLKSNEESNKAHHYKIIKQNSQNIDTFEVPELENYGWNEQNFCWIHKGFLYLYDFENKPFQIQLPKLGKKYYILNKHLFLWKSKVMYLYTVEIEK
ncbi:hypothetical protein Ga0061079_10995 [Apibacter mensalis]|uniref:Uncharacterized protein n=1 Tax=Apibacter mensalis TaxID=1586267 RepID=A0A0X3ARL7_9FLAO|nr:hypothetical protein [Apibacter mensalis]CVK16705.1 hypothetical protein Ga0061079_10995 [Apibacter mensalis]